MKRRLDLHPRRSSIFPDNSRPRYIRHDDGGPVRRFDHFNRGRKGGRRRRWRSGLCVTFRNVCVRNVTASSGAERDHMISSRLSANAAYFIRAYYPVFYHLAATPRRFIYSHSLLSPDDSRRRVSLVPEFSSSRRNAQRTRKNGRREGG